MSMRVVTVDYFRRYSCSVAAVVCLAWIGVHAFAAETGRQADAPRCEKTDLFQAGQAGYVTYRIPALATTRKGTILAACSARRDGFGDWADIDVMFRRSTDGGETWSAPVVLADSGNSVVDNATFIIDPHSDQIYLLYQIDYARAFLMTSNDEGATWSKSREITGAFDTFRARDQYDWKVLAMGPGHGIVLASGRFVVPVWLATDKSHRPSISATIYSDDQGDSWHAGETIVANSKDTPNPSEHVLVELADGRVMTNMRTESKQYRRLVSISPNGASDWSPPKFDEQLYDPICMASLVRLGATAHDDAAKCLVFANPDSRAAESAPTRWGARERRNVTVRLSHDDGQSWPISRVMEAGPSGYSDLSVAPDGTIYMLYERGAADQHGAFHTGYLTFAEFNRAWLAGDDAGVGTEFDDDGFRK
jgi:sialidase-1